MSQQFPALLSGVGREQTAERPEPRPPRVPRDRPLPRAGVDGPPGRTDQLHEPGYGYIQVIRLDLAGDLVDGAVRHLAQLGPPGRGRGLPGGRTRGGNIGGSNISGDTPDPAEELHHGFRVHVRPVNIVLGRAGE